MFHCFRCLTGAGSFVIFARKSPPAPDFLFNFIEIRCGRMSAIEAQGRPGGTTHMAWEWLIEQYGYLAVLAGTLVEGELVVVLGAIAAQLGYLDIIPVVLLSAIGVGVGDQLSFFLGRRGGRRILERRPGLAAAADKVFPLLQRHETLVILGYRFLYGMRLSATFIIGASPVSTRKFLLLSSLGILLWASVMATLGYVLGYTLTSLLTELTQYRGELAAIVIALVVMVSTAVWVQRRRVQARAS